MRTWNQQLLFDLFPQRYMRRTQLSGSAQMAPTTPLPASFDPVPQIYEDAIPNWQPSPVEEPAFHPVGMSFESLGEAASTTHLERTSMELFSGEPVTPPGPKLSAVNEIVDALAQARLDTPSDEMSLEALVTDPYSPAPFLES